MPPDGRFILNSWHVLHVGPGVNLEILLEALQRLVDRHEPLRTTFDRGEPPRQLIWEHAALTVDVVHLDGEDSVEDWVSRAVGVPQDRRTGPLFEARVLHHRGTTYLILLADHLISDGWSAEVMLRELGVAYHAIASREPVLFEALPVQFADYAAWQHTTLTEAVTAGHLAYWRTELAGSGPYSQVELPFLHAPAATGWTGGVVSVPLTAEQSHAIRRTARLTNVSPYTLSLAALSIVCGGYLAERNSFDLIVHGSLSGRVTPELHHLVGWFANTVPYRIRWTSDTPIREVLEIARTAIAGALAHEQLPFAALVQAIDGSRYLGTPRQPGIFLDVNLSWRLGTGIDGLRCLSHDRFVTQTAPGLHITIDLAHGPARIYCRFGLSSCTAPDVLRFLGEIKHVLLAMPAYLDRPASRLAADSVATAATG